MAYDKGKLIERKPRGWDGRLPEGAKGLMHVSRETLNRPMVISGDGILKRKSRRARRKHRMLLRKRRGWR